MTAVSISEFRDHLKKYLEQAEKGEAIIVTSRGREVAAIVPPGDPMKRAREKMRALRKTAAVGDVLSPVGESWEADE